MIGQKFKSEGRGKPIGCNATKIIAYLPEHLVSGSLGKIHLQ